MAVFERGARAARSRFVPSCAICVALALAIGSPGCLNPMPDDFPSNRGDSAGSADRADNFTPIQPPAAVPGGEGEGPPTAGGGAQGTGGGSPSFWSDDADAGAPIDETPASVDAGADGGE